MRLVTVSHWFELAPGDPDVFMAKGVVVTDDHPAVTRNPAYFDTFETAPVPQTIKKTRSRRRA